MSIMLTFKCPRCEIVDSPMAFAFSEEQKGKKRARRGRLCNNCFLDREERRAIYNGSWRHVGEIVE